MEDKQFHETKLIELLLCFKIGRLGSFNKSHALVVHQNNKIENESLNLPLIA